MYLEREVDKDDLLEIPELLGYYALTLAILKDYSASKALRYIRN